MNRIFSLLGKSFVFLVALSAAGALASYSGLVTFGSSVGNPIYSQQICGSGSVAVGNPCPSVMVQGPPLAFTASGAGLATIGSGTYLDLSVLGAQGVSIKVTTNTTTLTWYQSQDGVTNDPVECTRSGTSNTITPLPTYFANYPGNTFFCRVTARYFAINAAASGATGYVYPAYGEGGFDRAITGTNTLSPQFVTPPQLGAYYSALSPSTTGTTGVVSATLPASASVTNYICGYKITSTATGATSGTATITGTATGTLSVVQGVGLSPAVVTTDDKFNPCIPASAVNTAITVNSIAAGTGGVTAVYVWGYRG
jgi:hypothetical protein